MIHKNNPQLLELQFYINNIERCLDKVDVLSVRIQNHQWYTIIKYATHFTSQLSKNHNKIYKHKKLFIPNDLFIH